MFFFFLRKSLNVRMFIYIYMWISQVKLSSICRQGLATVEALRVRGRDGKSGDEIAEILSNIRVIFQK